MTDDDLTTRPTIQCRCRWAGVRCPNPATQEDGLCDWCGTRSPEQLAANPAAMFHAVTGELLGLGGSGQAHIDSTRRPDACWMPNSGRTLGGTDG